MGFGSVRKTCVRGDVGEAGVSRKKNILFHLFRPSSSIHFRLTLAIIIRFLFHDIKAKILHWITFCFLHFVNKTTFVS